MKFSLGNLACVILTICIGVAWFSDRTQLQSKIQDLERKRLAEFDYSLLDEINVSLLELDELKQEVPPNQSDRIEIICLRLEIKIQESMLIHIDRLEKKQAFITQKGLDDDRKKARTKIAHCNELLKELQTKLNNKNKQP